MRIDDDLDGMIVEALNAPLGEESPPPWEGLAEPARRRRPRIGQRARRRRRVGGTVLAVATAAIVGVTLALPRNGPSPIESAAAAFHVSGPVLHLRLATPAASVPTLDPATGALRTLHVAATSEIWYDRTRHIYKEVGRSARGTVVVWADRRAAISSYGPVRLPGIPPGGVWRAVVPAAVLLFSHYRDALLHGDVQPDGEGTVAGRRVLFLYVRETVPVYDRGRSQPPTGWTTTQEGRIAVDRTTYLPVAVYPAGMTAHVGYVRAVALGPRRPAVLARPIFPLVPATDWTGAPTVRRSLPLRPAALAAWLHGRAFPTPRTLAGRPFAFARSELLNPPSAAARRGAELTYGSVCRGAPRFGGRFVVVQLARTPEIAYGTRSPLAPSLARRGARMQVPLLRGMNAFSVCGAPKIGFYSGQDERQRLWIAPFRARGFFVSVSSPSLRTTIAATRELVRALR